MAKELYRTEDEQGLVIVTEQGDKRILSFASDLQQSCVDMHRPYYLLHEYTQIMLLGLVFAEPENITMLGLGGGGLAHCLNHFYPQCVTRVVEIRQEVIDVAYSWFNLPRKANLKVICSDANEYIKQVKSTSINLLLCDLYEANGMSEMQQQAEFIEHCYQTLNDDSCLVINFHNMPEEDSDVMQKIKQRFTEVFVCDVFIGNWVLFCLKANSGFEKSELEDRARVLAKKVGMPLMYYFKQLSKIHSM